ncbi:hypothetical protein MVES1_002038 [Malassezia vespertilionis]|uniref:Uncharacterized protein n=1 Tax=Malassezia vespertilionis TaxID=2020962 RepID=A0A2N1JBR7_9BASI|nr:uncharacterized protein MVES1_002038 [Malassezia vespertilionis]PKI83985.1 hypothetical protein MVES_001928 [Malassezia vespertilionis]WFD06684.1 hypothetical protein MVES1_002038 [Malassezia vespertilionis]
MASEMEEVWNSIFNAGVNSATHRIMNYAFYTLFLTLITMFLATGFSMHVFVLLLLSISLCVAVNMFVGELNRMQDEKDYLKAKKQ